MLRSIHLLQELQEHDLHLQLMFCCRLSTASSSAFILLSSNSMYHFSASTSCLINFAAMLSRPESTCGLFLLILSALFPVKGKQVYIVRISDETDMCSRTYSSSCECFWLLGPLQMAQVRHWYLHQFHL